jgi:hypothetical protein
LSPHVRYGLAAAAGFAAGILATCTDRRPAAVPPPPVVTVREGHVTADGRARELRPLTLRVGDDLRQVAPRARPDSATAYVYLEVGGVLVLASFELGD